MSAERPRPPRTPVRIALLLAAVEASAHDRVPGPSQTRPVLLRGGDLYTVSAGVLEETDLLFEGGRIVAIGPRLAAPEGSEIVDVSGERVYPGLIAADTRLGLVEIGAVRATSDVAEIGAVTPEVAAHSAFNPDSEILPTVRSHGITTVQVVPGGTLLRGRPFVTHLDGWTKEHSAVRLIDGLALAWPADAPRDGSGPPGARRSRETREKERRESVEALRRVFADARAYLANRRADPALPVDLRFEAMRAVLEGTETLYVAADRAGHIEEALEFATERGLRTVLVGGAEAYRVAGLLRERDVPVILGNALGLPPREDDAYDVAYRSPAVLREAGVRFCIADAQGSWSVRNLGLHAANSVAFGLPPDAALRAVTLSAAEILGIDDTQGSLEVGKAATLFVSDGDALDSLDRRVTRMWIDGREVDLDDRHKALHRKYRQR